MSAVPSHPDAVRPEWLTQILHDHAMAEGAAITHISWELIGTGQVGDSVRFFLSYDKPGAGPATLAGKFPAADPASRATAQAFGLYAKEVGFYRELAPLLDIRVPRALAAEMGDELVEFALIFEDLGPARGGNQLTSCSIGDARHAMVQAAALHAPSWDNPALIEKSWLKPRDGLTEQVNALYANAQIIFRERYGDVLEPEYMAICEELNEGRSQWLGRDHGDKCLIHGDFRLDNMLFDIHGGTEAIAVLDWQTVATGSAMTDIGYFLGTGIGRALRQEHEDELLDLYCAEMTGRGIELSRDAIWDDYAIGALHGISTAVFSAAYVERTERGDANFLSMARGGCSLALEHASLARMKGLV